MKAFFIRVAVILFVLCSCQNRQNNSNIPVIDIDQCDTRDLLLSEFAETVDYIPLETHDSCLIVAPYGLKMLNGDLYLGESGGDQGLYCFSQDGRLKYKMTKYGRGPGEYINLMNFDIDVENKLIYAMDFTLKKIMVFNPQLDFIREFSFEEQLQNVTVLPNGKLAVVVDSTPDKNRNVTRSIFIVSAQGEVEKKNEVETVKDMVILSGNGKIVSSHHKMIWGGFCKNTIYESDGDQIIPIVNVDFGKDDMCELKSETADGQPGPSDFVSKIRVEQSNDNFAMLILIGEKAPLGFLSKKNNELIKYENIINDKDGLFMNPYLIGLGKNRFFRPLFPVDLIDHYNENKGKVAFSNRAKALIKQLSPDDNPVLMLIKTKERFDHL